ncbi:uncharacterized protein [Leptinotarsa decemlineata]|uniref:uncharacterized protein n=1 Tax=Leptinotarsa decemlineata TaxID=7539 RepID=UPI003D30B38D
MSRKMVINRLEKDELIYELTIRGVAAGTVEEMRHRLATALHMEKCGDSLRYPDHPFDFAEDGTAVEKTLCSLRNLLTDFQGTKDSNDGLKIQTKISHLLGRLERMEPKDGPQKATKSDLYAQALTLINDFMGKTDDAAKIAGNFPNLPPALAQLETRLAIQSFNANLHGVAHSSMSGGPPPDPTSAGNPANFQNKMVPPHKWNIKKFTGDSKGMSITAFFETIEEHRQARNVPETILLDSGMDLFADKAYQFYKDCRNRVNSWKELVEEFREEYLSAYHMDALFEELQRRTQHSSESIGVYLAVMSSYFKRLMCPMTEDAKLAILLKNLHPFYQERLGDPLPNTIDELRNVCRRIENRRDIINSYVEPLSRRANIIEKDLAYVEVTEDLSALDVAASEPFDNGQQARQVICFRCKAPGHRAIGCAIPKLLKCFGCNREGYTKRNCPSCSSKGNG